MMTGDADVGVGVGVGVGTLAILAALLAAPLAWAGYAVLLVPHMIRASRRWPVRAAAVLLCIPWPLLGGLRPSGLLWLLGSQVYTLALLLLYGDALLRRSGVPRRVIADHRL